MNRQDILLGAKAECLRLFALLLPNVMKLSADKLFAMAYKTTNFAEHRLFLDAYAALANHEFMLKHHLETSLEDLLARSMQTAYNPQRPSIAQAASTDTWLLVESSIIEDEIRLHKITSLFHNKSGADIRDLNLRIAALFKQNIVKERENPFRPYLFSRCISASINSAALPSDVALALVEQLAAGLLDGVADIYRALNIFFEKNGVAATLPATEKVPSSDQSSVLPGDSSDKGGQGSDPNSPKNEAGRDGSPPATNGDAVKRGTIGNVRDSGASSAEPRSTPMRKVDQLLRMVRRKTTPDQNPSGKSVKSNHLDARESDHDGRSAIHPAGGSAHIQRRNLEQPDSGGDEFPVESPIPDTGLAKGWISGKQVVGVALQRFFAERGSDAAVKPAGPDESIIFPSGTSRIMAESSVYHFLKKAKTTRLEDVMGEDGEVRNLILEGRSSLVSRASDANEMMTIDVVGMIFEFILRDPQVPAEVRAQLGRLQFLLLKVALFDPRLLTQKDHPARKLINRIGTISLGLRPEDLFTARFTAEIHRIVEALLADESDSIVLISKLLEEFETFISQNFRFSNANVERAVEAMEEAEKRSIYFARSLAKLKEIFLTVKTDPYLQNFIETTWLRTIEKAEHADAELATRYRRLVPELVWSILEKRSERERARLLSHLPQMLFDLKAGLSSVKYAEKQAFLSWLIESHTRAIKAVGDNQEYFSLSALRRQFHSFIDNPASEESVDEGAARFDRTFISDAVEEMEVRLDQIETVLEFGRDLENQDAPQFGTETPDINETDFTGTESVLNRLRVGVPVEINVDGAPRRAMLNWMNTSATNMILSVEGNNFPTTISVGLFRRLLANSRARFIEAAPLFERAVTSLLETADKVDEIFE